MGVDRLLIDVGVTAAKCKRDALVSSDQEVQAAIQAHKSQSLNEDLLCENESDEDPTLEVLQLRTFRRLVVEEAVSPALYDMLKRKFIDLRTTTIQQVLFIQENFELFL